MNSNIASCITTFAFPLLSQNASELGPLLLRFCARYFSSVYKHFVSTDFKICQDTASIHGSSAISSELPSLSNLHHLFFRNDYIAIDNALC